MRSSLIRSGLLLVGAWLPFASAGCSDSAPEGASPTSGGAGAGNVSGGGSGGSKAGSPSAGSAGAAGSTNGAGGSAGSTAGSGGSTAGSGGSTAGSGGSTAGSGGSTAGSGGSTAGSGGSTAGSGGSKAGGGSGGSAGSAAGSGGSSAGGGSSACTPNSSGALTQMGDTVFDPKTCLTWMRSNTSGDPYAAADTYCAGLSLGGYDDWRLPSAGEVATIFKCDNTYPPVFSVFQVMGDGIWTTTLSGTIAGDQPKVCGAGQSSGQFYDFGKVGGQNTRCVRGPATIPDRTDCKTNNSICK